VTCTATGLTNGTAYYFKVAAINSAGTSAYSTASAAVTPATVPGAPTIGVATATGATTATVAFTAPVSDGGATITTYTATSTPTGGSGTLSSAGSGTINVTGLTTGTSYTFTVTATNSVGTSAASAASAAVTPLTCAAGGACALGDIGPGDGLVFYDAGSVQAWGRYLEMAPKTWSGGSRDPGAEWCDDTSTSLAVTFGTAIGTGAQNTVLMDTGCTSGAGQEAADYAAGVYSDWFLPSQDELNEMYGYKNSIVDTATYGFNSGSFWSSSQNAAGNAWYQDLDDGNQLTGGKGYTLRVRPVRAF